MTDDQPLPRPTGAVRHAYLGPEGHPPGTGPTASGYMIDGHVFGLDGQPPIAKSKGWGDMAWWAWHRLRGPWTG